ncbi:MAG: hypothetical protein HY516_03595 [Candidatus Aenigmarchaeota archaeon]|nr:hypothetical protein [Candidatus Aenigmarchaeota archaeon]
MPKAIGDLYVPEASITEVVLDVGDKLSIGPLWADKVKRLADSLPRNERMPAYRSYEIKKGKLVLQCDETDYATYLASVKGEIPEARSMPMGVIGVPRSMGNVISVGVVAKSHRLAGMYQGVPAGGINLDELDATMSPIATFNNELFEEVNVRADAIRKPVFLGLVSDRKNHELAITYGFDTGMSFEAFSNTLHRAATPEYEYLVPVIGRRSDLFRFARGAEKTPGSQKATVHCRGAIALYALREFPDSPLVGFLADSDNRIFGYLK